MNRLRPRLAAPQMPAPLAFAVVAVGCFVVARLGMLLDAHPGRALAALAPECGLAIAAVLLGGRSRLPAVALGGLASSFDPGRPLAIALLPAVGATLTAWFAYELLRFVGFRASLRRTSDVTGFVLFAGLLGGAVGAGVEVAGLILTGAAGDSHVLALWRDLSLANLSGVVLVGSAALVLGHTPASALRSRALVEVLLTSAVVGALSYALLDSHGSVPYLVLPLLFVLAIVYRQRGAAIGGLIVSVAAVAVTLHGHGPFPGGSEDAQLIRTDVFMCVGVVTALLVAAAQSERRVAEQAVDRLAESESALAEAQRLARIGSFEIDCRSGRMVWSDELYRIFALAPEGVVPGWKPWLDCTHPDDRPRLEEAIAQVDHAIGRVEIVHRIVRPDGPSRIVEVQLRSEGDGTSPPVRIVGTCQDVTAEKLAEQRLRTLFEDAAYPIVVLDAAGSIVLSNVRAQLLFGFSPDELAARGIRELVSSPDGAPEDWWSSVGQDGLHPDVELWARRPDGTQFPVEVSLTPLESEDGVLMSAAIRDVTLLRRAAEALVREARHDPLTGLPNRLMFLERLDRALARARRSGRELAVVFIDLDDFKEVNDRRGHDAGDLLLRTLTERLSSVVREGDTLARLGGDEFVVLCEDLDGEAEAITIAQRLAAVASEPVAVGGHEHVVSLSAGVVMVPDPAEASGHAVLRDADAAMYAAKESGKGRVAVFDNEMRELLSERTAIEDALRGALSREELTLRYQPVVELGSGRIAGVEALLRWRHPTRGLMAPAEFIEVAESTGLIGEIGRWGLEHACRQAALWRDAVGSVDPVPVSVNVSAFQLTRTDLVGDVRRALERTGLAPHLLEIEVTEAVLLEEPDSAGRQLERLKRLGVRLVVDDFGAGYSSLLELRRLGIDGLKLDRSFVLESGVEDDDVDGGALIGAVVGMGRALGAAVIGEGVETAGQAERLSRHGCELAQGHLFAAPLAAGELTRRLIAERDGRVAGVAAGV